METQPLDIVIAHDYLTQRGGAEKVVLALTRGFSAAPIFTTLYKPEATYSEFATLEIRTTWLNNVPLLRRWHRLALPLLALAVGKTPINARVTIVSSSGWAHGFRVTGAKLVYCYSPARWLYQEDRYVGGARVSIKRAAIWLLAPALRRWDAKQARTATKYFAISNAVRERIRDAYGIEAEVLPAPHSVDTTLEQEAVDVTGLASAHDGFYLCVSRLLPYKNVDVVMRAFARAGLPVVIVGAGPEERRLRGLTGDTSLMLKNLSDGELRWLYANCEAVISASYEDYGLTPLEAAAYGKPSIVLRWGGFLDTVLDAQTGVFFDEPRDDLVAAAIEHARGIKWDADAIRRHAEQFTEARFLDRLRAEAAKYL